MPKPIKKTTMKYKILTTAMMMAAAGAAMSQTAITFVGGDAASHSGSISYTCGETAVQHSVARAITVVNITEYFIEGIQQTYGDKNADIVQPLGIAIVVYPNPTADWVTISHSGNTNSMEYTLFDIAGRNLLRGDMEENEVHVDMSALPSGTYLLQIVNPQENKKNSYKIIKK